MNSWRRMPMSQQIVLFEQPRPTIGGLTYVPDFIAATEEAALVEDIEAGHWTHEFARRRQHYGMDYAKANSAEAVPLPEWIEVIAQKIVARGLFAQMPAHALVFERTIHAPQFFAR